MNTGIANKATQLTIAKIISLAIVMVNAMILSRYRTLEEYGTYSQLNVVITLLTTIIMIGLPNSINYFMAKAQDNQERTQFLSNYYTISTILSVIAGLILILIIPYLSSYFDNTSIISFSFYLLLMPWISIIGASVANILIVYNKVKLLSIYNILTSVALLVILVISTILKLSFIQYMYLNITYQVCITVTIYFVVSKLTGGLQPSLSKSLIKTILKFSIPIGLATIVGTINIDMDRLMIGYFFNTETMAIYTNAAREMPVTIISASITAVLMPHLVRLIKDGKIKEAISVWSDSISLSYAFICFFSIVLFVFAPEVMTILYSEKYLPGIPVFRIYSLVLLLRCTYFGIILNSVGKTKFILYSSIAALGLNVLLNFLFFYMFGLIGPAIATFVSMFLVALFQLLKTSELNKISLDKIFPWREISLITMVNVILGASIYSIKKIIVLDQMIGNMAESIILGFFWLSFYNIIMNKFVRSKWEKLN